MEVFMTLGYTPDWVPRVARTRSDTYNGNDEPLTSTEWIAFVEAAVAHYQPLGVTHYGLWNEANLGGFWEEAAGSQSWIDKILVPGAAAVKRVCPTCKVLGPELAHVGEYQNFMRPVLMQAGDVYDIITHHSYNGWAQLGLQIWDGDSFLNAIETRRFSFTRPALKELLDEFNITVPVWITETGLKAAPAGDVNQENRQAQYVELVMDAQLARPWWTNTFFYEIMDCGVDAPTCDIDGFGIARPTRDLQAGSRSFADYRQKPAYTAIKTYITAHPEIVVRAPPAQCADGMDNDADGRVDSADRGCADGTDTNESDDPPRRRLVARTGGALVVDGALGDWNPGEFTTLPAADWRGVVAQSGAGDQVVSIAARHMGAVLYLAVRVTDDTHVNTETDDGLWRADSVQLAFDVARNGGAAYDTTNDHEINLGLVNGVGRAFRFIGPAAATNAWTVAATRAGNDTLYELSLPAAVLSPATLAVGGVVGFSFLVNDNDGQVTADLTGREGWTQFTDGIGVSKRPEDFGELELSAETVTTLDAGVVMPDAAVVMVDAAVSTPDAAVRPDAAVVVGDAGAPPPDAGTTGRDAGSVTPGTDAGVGEETPDALCNCRSTGEDPLALGAALLVMGLLLGRRRDKKHGHHSYMG